MAMNFRRRRPPEDPEINLIPFIDVLLVILIFLMLTTTYSKVSELKINLPTASADTPQEKPLEIRVAVNPAGEYLVNQQPVAANALGDALKAAAGGQADPSVVIQADGKAPHQAVVTVMEAARQASLSKLTFATQAPAAQ